MLGKIYRSGVLMTLTILLLLGMVLVVSSSSEVGVVSEVGTRGKPLQLSDYATIPQSVVDDANEVASSLFGNARAEATKFVDRALALYSEARDKDVIILFNPGGWGEKLLEDAPGWMSIMSGIRFELQELGYKFLSLDYQRTEANWGRRLAEAEEMMACYPDKARDLACQIEFLTRNLPGLRVILAAESTGSVIADAVMDILKNNPQVYSIQTGPPFWHKSGMRDRTLVLTSSGITPDSFSLGDFRVIIGNNLKDLFRPSRSPDGGGRVLNSMKAPGHVYWWPYPEVYSKITEFLEQNFGVKVKPSGEISR